MPPAIAKGKKFLKGLELNQRLGTLQKTVVDGCGEAYRHNVSFLEEVRRVGEALEEAKWRTGAHGKWGKWLRRTVEKVRERNISFSCTTAGVYRRVAREWDDPDFKELRETGAIKSIAAFLKRQRDHRRYLKAEAEREAHAARVRAKDPGDDDFPAPQPQPQRSPREDFGKRFVEPDEMRRLLAKGFRQLLQNVSGDDLASIFNNSNDLFAEVHNVVREQVEIAVLRRGVRPPKKQRIECQKHQPTAM